MSPLSDREVYMSGKVREGMIEGSWIRRMFEEGARLKQKYGADKVFDLSIGNPVMEPPQEFFSEFKKLSESSQPGLHRYMENAGYPDTRAAVAAQLTRELGVKLTTDDVIMTTGAAGAMNVALKTLVNTGDEVIVFSPYFVEYLNYVDNHGGVAHIVPTGDDFLPRLDVLEGAISSKTRVVIINSPHNPTGVVYSERVLKGLGNLLQKMEARYGTSIYILSDEPYRRLIYDGMKFPSPLLYHDKVVIASSHSKDLAIPGERIGYLAINANCPHKKDVVDGFIHCNRILGFVNAPAIMQHIVRNLQAVTVSIADYQNKRDLLYGGLIEAGYKLAKPQGGFYVFPSSLIPDDVAFVRALQEELVLGVPGSGFGTPGYFRVSYCVEDKTIKGALEGLRRVAKKFGAT